MVPDSGAMSRVTGAAVLVVIGSFDSSLGERAGTPLGQKVTVSVNFSCVEVKACKSAEIGRGLGTRPVRFWCASPAWAGLRPRDTSAVGRLHRFGPQPAPAGSGGESATAPGVPPWCCPREQQTTVGQMLCGHS